MAYPPTDTIPPIVLPPKYVSETPIVSPDFSPLLAPTDSVSSVNSVTVTVLSGTDPSPSSLLKGTAQISGNVVNQQIQGGVAGTQYLIAISILSALGITRTVKMSIWVVA